MEDVVTHAVPRALCQFVQLRFTRDYWALASSARQARQSALLTDLLRCSAKVDFYQIFPTTHAADLCAWLSVAADSPGAAAQLFAALARASAPHRQFVEVTANFWGYSRPSTYSNAQRSAQGIDPFAAQRRAYLVIYPFVKTAEWYLKPREERQELMNEHIRIGKQYTDISQLLLYSVGLQDQEFVVVYEMDDLERFSDLVGELRATAGRPYTLRDTPVQTGIWRGENEILELFG